MRRAGFLQRPDCRIYYEVEGSGPAIVFAHGLGGNHLSWWQQVAHFAPRYTCVAFAHRGFMPSDAFDGARAPEHFADDLAALVDHLALEDVRLVAQSMGGWTCLAYALSEPRRVRALVMASTSGAVDFSGLDAAAGDEVREWMRRAPGALTDLEARGLHAAAGERMHREQPAAAHLYGQISRLTPQPFRDAAREKIRAMRVQPPKLLGELAMPVLFLTGGEDWVFPPAAGPALAAYARAGRAERIAQAGHSVYFERPDHFNRIVGEFIA